MGFRGKRQQRQQPPDVQQVPTPRILLGVPAVSWLYTEAAVAIMNVYTRLPAGSLLNLNSGTSSSIAANRNHIVRRFLRQKEFDYLLFIDSDMTPPANVASVLWRAAQSSGAGIVSALYFDRHKPFEYYVTFLPDHPYHRPPYHEVKPFPAGELRGVHEVRYVGMGCALVSRALLEAMPDPHFVHASPGWSEDFAFCHRARELGFKVVLCADVVAGHLGVISVTRELSVGYGEPMSEEEVLRQYADANYALRDEGELRPVERTVAESPAMSCLDGQPELEGLVPAEEWWTP